ncbi:MAG: 4Fe-4S dicluster domain-containing protein [Thermodesulfobacteriota bacterium]
MPSPVSRRGFLKAGLAAAAGAGLAAGQAALPQALHASAGGQLCTVLDLSRCIGCEACVDACRDQWQASVPDPVSPIPQPFPPRVPIEDWSQKKDVRDRLTPYNFLYVEHLDLERQGKSVELHIPRRCMHCVNPPCTNLCPFGAGKVERSGVVHIDPDICLGGAKCKQVCPWQVPQRQSGMGLYLHILPEYAGNGVMFKCHRCLPLVEKGQAPRCIEACPNQAQTIGPRAAQVAQATELARRMAQADGRAEAWREYVYGLDENGGTNTLYVSPVPFPVVNAALNKLHLEQAEADGPSRPGQGRGQAAKDGRGQGRRLAQAGRPHMGPVANSMQSEENLAKALVIAPVAGLIAGLGGLLGGARKLGRALDKAQSKIQKGGQS